MSDRQQAEACATQQCDSPHRSILSPTRGAAAWDAVSHQSPGAHRRGAIGDNAPGGARLSLLGSSRGHDEEGQEAAGAGDGRQLKSSVELAETRRRRLVTTALVYGASVLERADEQILPSAYMFIGRSLLVSPTELGGLTFARALVQALSSPVSGVLGDRYDRTWVIAAGCCVWGLMTAMFGFVTSLPMAMLISGANGFGLALVIPCCQSMIADYYASKDRGKAFGLLFMVSILGGLGGGLLATNLGGRIVFGVEGWRVVYQLVGLISALCGALVLRFATDPRPALPASGAPASPSLWPETMAIFRLRTFQVIILQGIVGSMPWFCMGYFTLWFQLLGFTDLQASLLMGVFQLGNAKGAFLGGWLGDAASRWSPNHGRILVAQASVAAGLPMIAALLKGLPAAAGVAFPPYFVTLWAMGLLISWSATGCNNPVFADVVPEHLRSMIYAYDRCLEGGIAAMITPLVGLLAERSFHYQRPDPAHPMSPGEMRQNADALGSALLVSRACWRRAASSAAASMWPYMPGLHEQYGFPVMRKPGSARAPHKHQ